MHVSHLLPDLSLNTDDFEEAIFVEKNTANGKHRMHLYKEGHVFYRTNYQIKNNCYWLCKEYYNRNGSKCTAKATTKGNKVLTWSGHHNHDVVEPSK